MVVFSDGKLIKANTALPNAKAYNVYFIGVEELPAAAKKLDLQNLLKTPLDENASNHFESHKDFDCLMLNIPDGSENIEAPPLNIDIYYSANKILFVHDPSSVIQALVSQMQDSSLTLPFDRLLYTFFNLLTESDSSFLENIEEEIANLEDLLLEDNKQDYNAKISTLRKRLLKLKRYYESLFDALVDMEENENCLLTEAQLRNLHIITNRADRLLHSVLNLRDYVTQVREAYQAQIDISLNQTMKLFTVITTIFLPLTLIVGWYGMNLQMPEFQSPYAYAAVICVCILLVVSCLIYFRRKKWF